MEAAETQAVKPCHVLDTIAKLISVAHHIPRIAFATLAIASA